MSRDYSDASMTQYYDKETGELRYESDDSLVATAAQRAYWETAPLSMTRYSDAAVAMIERNAMRVLTSAIATPAQVARAATLHTRASNEQVRRAEAKGARERAARIQSEMPCAWCTTTKDPNASHGICEACRTKFFPGLVP
jgi:hypothetical protein